MKDVIKILTSLGLLFIVMVLSSCCCAIFNIEPQDWMQAVGYVSVTGWCFLIANLIVNHIVRNERTNKTGKD